MKAIFIAFIAVAISLMGLAAPLRADGDVDVSDGQFKTLIAALSSSDVTEQSKAADRLAALGQRARPALITAINGDNLAGRQAAAQTKRHDDGRMGWIGADYGTVRVLPTPQRRKQLRKHRKLMRKIQSQSGPA